MPETSSHRPAVVAVAIGNELRRDDGAAHRVLEIFGSMKGVTTHACMQLTPELAEEICLAGTVVFVDADVHPGPAYLEALRASVPPTSPVTHSLSPEEVATLARELYGFKGSCYVCHVPGIDFGTGRGLTPEAERNAQLAVRLLREVCGTALGESALPKTSSGT